MIDKKAISESIVKSCAKIISEEILSHSYNDGRDLLSICIDIVDPDRKKKGREAGVLQLGICHDTTTRMIKNVAGGCVAGDTLTYNTYINGKKETISQKLPGRLIFNG